MSRVGHHFANSVLARVCDELGIWIDPYGRICDSRNTNGALASGTNSLTHVQLRGPNFEKETRRDNGLISQYQFNEEARNAITDLFPKIPEPDLSDIIYRAFQMVICKTFSGSIKICSPYDREEQQ